tara:strand:- start:169 stop:1464 length:1296 start_codon:yes stop_codon:yes gene_type:complete
MLEPSQAEKILLSSIQTPTHLYSLQQKYGITSESFFYFQEPAKFIFDYIIDQGSAPTPVLISSTFENTATPFDPAPIDNFDYIAQQYATINTRQKAYMAIATAQKWLQESPNDGVMLLSKTLERIAKPDTTHRSSLERTTEGRWQSYLARRDDETVNRIKTGIQPLDDNNIWLQKQQLVGIQADTKIGKSWIAWKCASKAFEEGHKVLLISPELSALEMGIRSDVILSKLFGYTLSYQAIQRGDPSIGDEYKSYLESIAANKEDRWIQYDQVFNMKPSPSELDTVITQESPDVVIVDGIYLLRSDEKLTAAWEQIRSISISLKSLAVKHNVLLYATNQINRHGAQKSQDNDGEPPPPTDTAYGFDFARTVDILFGVGARSLEDTTRKVNVPLARSGPSFNDSFEITFVPDQGDIGRTVSSAPPNLIDSSEW